MTIFSQRVFEDANGIELVLIRMVWIATYAHFVDVEPQGVRQFLIQRADEALRTRPRGLYIADLPQMRQDLEMNSEDWVPPEYVEASLRSSWLPPEMHQQESEGAFTVLTATWHQQEKDPFKRLAAIVREVDWPSLSEVIGPDQAGQAPPKG